MKYIQTSDGKRRTKVDDDVYYDQQHYRWYSNAAGYFIRQFRTPDKQYFILLHRQVIGAKKGDIVDHINGDRCDNRRNNLRFVTSLQNCLNRGGNSTYGNNTPSSRYKGVSWDKKNKKWKSTIAVAKKTIHLGLYENEIMAVKVYNKKAKELFGEYAYINNIKEDS